MLDEKEEKMLDYYMHLPKQVIQSHAHSLRCMALFNQ